jgi:hypothetical protein
MQNIKAWIDRYGNVAFFVGGFLFDSLTLVRIDSVIDLVFQSAYLALITLMLIIQTKVDAGAWVPRGRWQKLWHYESEAIHFFYGGLLSAYVIFYFKSTTLSRSVVFWVLVFGLMFLNEMPQVRKAGSMMRLGLYSFCVVSFLNYLIPVLIGRMGTLIFILSWSVSVAAVGFVIYFLSRLTPDPARYVRRYSLAPMAVLIIVAVFYAAKLIPPVPLSMQYAGVFHSVERNGSVFTLEYEKPAWYKFWVKDDRDFKARPGDVVYFFTRVFAPRRFTSQIYIRWLSKDPATGTWVSHDRIPLGITGGRGEGFRGEAAKANYAPGEWRVDVESADGRALGGVNFQIENDASTGTRTLLSRAM